MLASQTPGQLRRVNTPDIISPQAEGGASPLHPHLLACLRLRATGREPPVETIEVLKIRPGRSPKFGLRLF